ncbi:site-specific integrase [Dysosmobacter welbionis]|mgnify:FL=1|uniref:tyrosine-type recombinase/integrase n=1 Tax=Dysosmobacter welbionis TaxID=2093857 RepID=UPI0029436520|nr:site-specific integrase [Dysosmobacter welbionis]
MASIRKRGSSYLLVVSMGYDYKGNRIRPKQKTVHPSEGLTPKQKEKWLNEQAILFERECKGLPQEVDRSITLAKYTELWLQTIAPGKLAKSTLARDRQDIHRFLPVLGHYKLTELRPEHFRQLYADLRKVKNQKTGKPLSECTVEGVHACLCGILSDAMEGGFLDHNPAWRTYRYTGKKKEKVIADEATTQRLIAALEEESLKYETYFKLIIATGMRRGECCGLQWGDINWDERSIHIQRNVVKVTGEDIIVKETKTVAGDRYVYFSLEMESLLKEFQRECSWETETYDGRKLEDADYIFRRHGYRLPMTPTTFTWRFKLILKKHGLPTALNVHSLRHTNASLLIAGGADVATVAGLLGHSQPSTTLDIYTHAFDKNKKAASQVLQEGLEI